LFALEVFGGKTGLGPRDPGDPPRGDSVQLAAGKEGVFSVIDWKEEARHCVSHRPQIDEPVFCKRRSPSAGTTVEGQSIKKNEFPEIAIIPGVAFSFGEARRGHQMLDRGRPEKWGCYRPESYGDSFGRRDEAYRHEKGVVCSGTKGIRFSGGKNDAQGGRK